MNNLKKVFTLGVVLTTIVWAMGVATFVPVANAQIFTPGEVFKGSLDTVYFGAADGKRYVYPQDKYYFTWQYDFSVVMVITDSELASIPLAGNVVTRYGTKLAKVQSIPTVYAVSRYGELYPIADEAAANALVGDFGPRVIDVQDAFWPNYTEMPTSLDGTWYPDGFLLKTAASPDVWIIWDGMKRLIPSEDVFYANRFMWEYVCITSQAVLDSYTEGAVVSGAEAELLDDSQGGGAIVPVEGVGTYNVSLSSSTPGPQTAPKGAIGIPVAAFDFTAGSDAAVTLNSLTIKHVGLGDVSDIAKVYLYKGSAKLSSGRTFSTSTNEAFFGNLNNTTGASLTDTLWVYVDVDPGAAAGGAHQFQVTNVDAVNSTAESVTGSFPVVSNTLTIGAVNVGKADVESSGATYTRKVGEQNVEVLNFTVHVDSTEDAEFSSITIYNAGRDIIDNLVLYRGSDMVSTCSETGDYFVCPLDTPWPILNSDSASFAGFGDITGRDGDSATLYVRYSTDVAVVGQTYGYNLAIDNTVGADANSYVEEVDATPSWNVVNAEAGQITVAFNGPSTSEVPKNSNDVVLMNFTITAQSNVDVEKTGIYLGGATPLDLSEPEADDLEVVCDGNVVTSWGSPVMDDDDDPTVGTVGYNTSSDVWSLPAGLPVECQVRLDITNNADGGEDVRAALLDLTSAYWSFKDADTGDPITDIVPSGHIVGNYMDVTAASLTIDLTSTPAAGSQYVKGTTGVDTVGFSFTAGPAADVKITSIKLTGFLDATPATWAFDGANDKNQLSGAQNVMVSVAIYEDGAMTPLAAPKSLTVGTTDISVQYDTLNWIVPAGTTLQLLTDVDVSTTAPTDADDDAFTLAIVNAADVKAEYGSGSNVPVTLTDGNDGGAPPSIYQVVTTGGTLAMSLDADTPLTNLVLEGSTGTPFTKVKFTSTKEAWVIERLRIERTGAGGSDEFVSVTISYTNSLGVTETKTAYFTGDVADLSGLDIYVPKDGSTVIEVQGNMNTVIAGADNGDDNELGVDSSASWFRAVAQSSGTVLTDAPGGTDIAGNTMYLYETVPSVVFASDTPSGALSPSAKTLVGKIKVTAGGNKDLTFDSTAASNHLRLEVAATGGDGVADDLISVEDNGGTTLCSDAAFNLGTTTFFDCDFTGGTGTFTTPATQTKYLYVFLDTSELTITGNQVQVWLDKGTPTNIAWSIDIDGNDFDHADILFRSENLNDYMGGVLTKN